MSDRSKRWEALLELSEVGIKWGKDTLGQFLANIPGETCDDAACLKWAANVFIDGPAKDRKLRADRVDEGFSLVDNILRVTLTSEGKKALRMTKGEDMIFDWGTCINERGRGNVITVIGVSGTGKTHAICEILKANLAKIGVLVGGVCPTNVCIFTGKKDSAVMYDTALGTKGCCTNDVAVAADWAEAAVKNNQKEPKGQRPAMVFAVDDPLTQDWEKHAFVAEIAAKAADLNITVIWGGQRYTGDRSEKCPIKLKNNSTIKIRLGGWSEQSDWKAALNDLGGRTSSGKMPFGTMKLLQSHFKRHTDANGRQLRPLVMAGGCVWTIDTSQPAVAEEAAAAAAATAAAKETKKARKEKKKAKKAAAAAAATVAAAAKVAKKARKKEKKEAEKAKAKAAAAAAAPAAATIEEDAVAAAAAAATVEENTAAAAAATVEEEEEEEDEDEDEDEATAPIVMAMEEKGLNMQKIGDRTRLMYEIPNFGEVLGIDPKAVANIMQKYPTADRGEALDEKVPSIISGEHDLLRSVRRQRAKSAKNPSGQDSTPMPRNKLFAQLVTKEMQKQGCKADYSYTGRNADVLSRKHDVRLVPELKEVADKVNDFFARLGPGLVKQFNDFIVTMYADGTMKMGRHHDKTHTLQKSDATGVSLILVIKLGEPRIFHIGQKDKTKVGAGQQNDSLAPFFDKVVQPMSAILMEVTEQEDFWHAVPEMEGVGASQSIVLRVAKVISAKEVQKKRKSYHDGKNQRDAERDAKTAAYERDAKAKTADAAAPDDAPCPPSPLKRHKTM